MARKPFTKSSLYQRLRAVRHGVIIVIGTGQWGKTVSVHSLIHSGAFPGRNVALVNYPPSFVKKHSYPDNYRAVKWPEDLTELPWVIRPSEDVVVLDDAIFLAGARDSTTRENKAMQKLMTIASHHELFIILTIQNSSLLDIGMMQSQDVYMLHKNMDTLSLQWERPEIINRQVVANSMLSRYMRDYPQVHPKAWTYSSTTHEMLSFPLPPWWQPPMSKPFYGVVPS